MLEWIGAPCIETLEIMYVSNNPIPIVFIFAYESRNAAMRCSDSESSRTFRDASIVRVDASLLL